MRVVISVMVSLTFSGFGAMLISSDGDGNLIDIELIKTIYTAYQDRRDTVDRINLIFGNIPDL